MITRYLSRVVVLALALTLASGCEFDLTVPSLNAPSIISLRENPTPAAVEAAATGLLVGAREGITGGAGYVSLLGILGRNSYNFDASDPRYVSALLVSSLDPGGFIGAGLWTPRYRNIRNAFILLGAVGQIEAYSEAEKEAIRGYAKTIQALDFLLVRNTRAVVGAPIDVDRLVTDDPAPLVAPEQVLQKVAALLDEGAAHLQNAAGAGFVFPLSSGFAAFSTPATFLEFNRALRARVAVYMEDYATALTALEASFLDTAAPLDLGAYHVYSTASGDDVNSLGNQTIVAHPSLLRDVEIRPNGLPDQRFLDRIIVLEEPRERATSQVTLESNLTFDITVTSPIPIIRNEGLILLRAEARWFTGDQQGALDDINFIRVNAGGLEPIAGISSTEEFITELLYNRRYSLLFTGGHRWIDTRRFGRFEALQQDDPVDFFIVHETFPIPANECTARDFDIPCSFQSGPTAG